MVGDKNKLMTLVNNLDECNLSNYSLKLNV
jgi:hypothetical protein